jgi:hypothetical protein
MSTTTALDPIVAEVINHHGETTVAGFTQWTKRENFESYLAWRTARGFTATFEEMLTKPFVIHYYDELYSATGIAAGGAAEEGTA